MPRTLEFSQYKGKVCTLLTAEQQVSLELPPQEHQGTVVCEFERWEPHKRLVIQLFPDDDVLERAYLESNQERWQQFEPVTLAGQPAVIRSFGPRGQNLTCEVVIGAGASRGIAVTAEGMDGTFDWCDKASSAAEYVIGNLRS